MTVLEPGPCTFHLEGDVDLATADGIAAMAGVAMAQGAPTLVLDLAGVTFMDSQGLRALVVAHRRLEEAGIAMELTGAPERVVQLLELTGLRQTFTLS